MMNNGNMPAMGGMIPRSEVAIRQEEALSKTRAERYRYQKGLTKREHYAGLAMQGLIAGSLKGDTRSIDEVASLAVKFADAVLKELDKNG